MSGRRTRQQTQADRDAYTAARDLAGQADHHAAGLGQAGFVAGVRVKIPDVRRGPDRNGAHGADRSARL